VIRVPPPVPGAPPRRLREGVRAPQPDPGPAPAGRPSSGGRAARAGEHRGPGGEARQLAGGRWARGAGRQGIAGRGLTGGVGPNGGRRSPKHGRGARRRPHVVEVSPVGGLGFGVAPPGRGTRQLTAAIGGGKGPDRSPRGVRTRGPRPEGSWGEGRQRWGEGRQDHDRRKYIYVPPTSKVHQRYISRPGGVGPPRIRQLTARIRQLTARIRQLTARICQLTALNGVPKFPSPAHDEFCA
jgi:hypothetical protein